MSKSQLLKFSFPIVANTIELKLFKRENITREYVSWLNNPLIVQFSEQKFKKHDFETSMAYFESFKDTCNLFLAIFKKDSHKMIGTMTVYYCLEHQVADIGILIGDQKCWGKGIGKEAWSTLISVLIELPEVRKVTGGTLACNHGMMKIMKAVGMEEDGVRKRQALVNESPVDVVYFAKFKP